MENVIKEWFRNANKRLKPKSRFVEELNCHCLMFNELIIFCELTFQILLCFRPSVGDNTDESMQDGTLQEQDGTLQEQDGL